MSDCAPYGPVPKTVEPRGKETPHLVCGPCPSCEYKVDHCINAPGGPDSIYEDCDE